MLCDVAAVYAQACFNRGETEATQNLACLPKLTQLEGQGQGGDSG